MSVDPRQYLAEIGAAALNHSARFASVWAQARGRLSDPVVLDKLALECAAIAQALALLGERAQGFSASILDEGE